MGQLYDDEVKGQNLSRMNLIVKRIEEELDQLKNLINEQIQNLTSANCDGNPGDSSIIVDDSYCLVDTLKIDDDLITITAEDHDYDVVNNYQEEFNKDQVNRQNRPSNVNEDELILGGINFEVLSNEAHSVNPQSLFTEDDKVIISQVHDENSVDLKLDLDSFQLSSENLEITVKNDLKLSQKSIVQMGVRCETSPIFLYSNRAAINQVSQVKNEINQKDGKIVKISTRPKGSLKKSHICSICSKSFKKISDLSRHMRIHTGERPFKCKICSKSFSLMGVLKRHSRIHTGERPYSCSFCTKSFTHNHHRNHHVLMIHKGVRCDHNPIILHSNQSAIDQVSQGKNERIQKDDGKTVEISSRPKESAKKSHICSTCSKSFQSFSKFSRHMMMVHLVKRPFKCKICSKSFYCIKSLKMHSMTHAESEKLFSCSVCLKSFKQNLNGHMMIHTGERPYSCSVCSKTFKQQSNLSAHMRVHTGERPFKCKICLKSFKRKEHLITHNLIHTGEKPYSCSICSKSFPHDQTRNDHIIRIHTDENPYSCSVCGKVFSTPGDLKKHENRIHVHGRKKST